MAIRRDHTRFVNNEAAAMPFEFPLFIACVNANDRRLHKRHQFLGRECFVDAFDFALSVVVGGVAEVIWPSCLSETGLICDDGGWAIPLTFGPVDEGFAGVP